MMSASFVAWLKSTRSWAIESLALVTRDATSATWPVTSTVVVFLLSRLPSRLTSSTVVVNASTGTRRVMEDDCAAPWVSVAVSSLSMKPPCETAMVSIWDTTLATLSERRAICAFLIWARSRASELMSVSRVALAEAGGPAPPLPDPEEYGPAAESAPPPAGTNPESATPPDEPSEPPAPGPPHAETTRSALTAAMAAAPTVR